MEQIQQMLLLCYEIKKQATNKALLSVIWNSWCRWEDNIKMDLKEVGYDARNWMQLARDSKQLQVYVRAVMNLWVLYKYLVRTYMIAPWRRRPRDNTCTWFCGPCCADPSLWAMWRLRLSAMWWCRGQQLLWYRLQNKINCYYTLFTVDRKNTG